MTVLNQADNLRLGAAQVDRAYLGANLVWEPAVAADYAAEVLVDGPVLYWRMEETSGSVTADGSGSGYEGTVYGADLDVDGPGSLGSAASFDGIDDRIDVSATTTPTNADFTWELWLTVDAASADGEHRTAIATGVAGDSLNQTYLYSATGFGSANNGIRLWDRAINSEILVGPDIRGTGWRHVVLTRTGDLFTLYVDGSVHSTATLSGSLSTNTNFAVGWSSVAGRYHFGKVDEVAVYQHALSGARVGAHYNAAGVA